MRTIVGIDEVGRGPLAGPVTICIVACGYEIYKKLKKDKRLPPLGKDSKKLKASDRLKYAETLNYIGVPYVVVHVSSKIIDKKGISFSIRRAINTGLEKLKLDPNNCKVLLDGGLRAPLEFKNQTTIIKGDEKERIIAWASILAKVSRDSLMVKLSKKYPQYGLEKHKGYGTLEHRQAVQKYGFSDIHRKTFCKKFKN
ncbi:MAG: ribonuclease HII [Candidatus Zambryskibacteria bacterium]|nr:ribonuclease HII [Candidatus Zambryskibacteria bacterium]